MGSGIKKREPVPGGGTCSRSNFGFHNPFATSPGRVKGKLRSVRGQLPGFAPRSAVINDPVGQGAFEADVVTGLLGLDPLVPEYFVPFCLKLAIKRGVLQQIGRR